MTELDSLVEQLKSVKEKLSEVQLEVDDAKERLEASSAWAEYQAKRDYLDTIKAIIAGIDDDIRGLAITRYVATGDKKPHPKVSIAISKSLEYNPDRAIRWAVANDALDMVKLLTKDFEKHARRVADTVPLDFVKIEDKPQVKIAKEL